MYTLFSGACEKLTKTPPLLPLPLLMVLFSFLLFVGAGGFTALTQSNLHDLQIPPEKCTIIKMTRTLPQMPMVCLPLIDNSKQYSPTCLWATTC